MATFEQECTQDTSPDRPKGVPWAGRQVMVAHGFIAQGLDLCPGTQHIYGMKLTPLSSMQKLIPSEFLLHMIHYPVHLRK